MNLVQWFEKGMTPEEYILSMKTNKEGLQSILEKWNVPEADLPFWRKVKQENLRVIVLTEDWCGDAMLNVPILLKIADKAAMDVRMLLRDQNLELMDQYLTNGTSRAIPIFIFIDVEGNERAVWGPRAETAQNYVDQEREKLPPKDDEQFEEKQKEMYGRIRERFLTDTSLWNDVYESIKTRLQTSLGLE